MLWKLPARRWQYTSWRSLSIRSRAPEPLRILFCGSDDFSIASLRALYEYSKTPGNGILSIDVAARNDKLAGRGMKTLKPPLIKSVAQELGLRLHQFNTFTGWAPPDFSPSHVPYINLIVAVSFGLLIPARIINSANFGGLNVHPSLLPELRGAAPLNWTIIKGHKHTGVSIQTLHPTKFDQGLILAQTPEIPVPDDITAKELRNQLGPVGGELLVQAIRERLYLSQEAIDDKGLEVSSAPKITTAMKALDWTNDDIDVVARKSRAIPKLWAYALQKDGKHIRILLSDDTREELDGDLPLEVRKALMSGKQPNIEDGVPFAITGKREELFNSTNPLFLVTRGKILVIPKLLVAGQAERYAVQAAKKAKLFQGHSIYGEYTVHRFYAALTSQKGNAPD